MSDNPNTVVVDRAQYDLHQRSAAILAQMLGDPRTAAEAEKIVATINPNAQFPGRQAREAVLQPVMAELEKERAKFTALEARIAAREAKEAEADQRNQEADLTGRLESVRAKRGFSEEMMTKVITRMRDQNNPDIDAAAAWVAETVPKPGPAVGHDFLPSTVDAYGSSGANEVWKPLHDNPQRWQDDMLRNLKNDPEFLRLGAV